MENEHIFVFLFFKLFSLLLLFSTQALVILVFLLRCFFLLPSLQVHFLGSLPEDSSVVEGSHSWELVASGHDAPFWWCHGIEIVDVTMRPERALTVADAQRTLQVGA